MEAEPRGGEADEVLESDSLLSMSATPSHPPYLNVRIITKLPLAAANSAVAVVRSTSPG
jgi:hypothetical protein